VMLDVPGGAKLQWVYDMYKAYYPELAAKPGYPQTYMPYGIPSAMTVVNALKAAGPQLTREKFLSAVARTKFDSKVMAGPIELTETDHAGQKAAIYLKFDGENKTAVPGTFKDGSGAVDVCVHAQVEIFLGGATDDAGEVKDRVRIADVGQHIVEVTDQRAHTRIRSQVGGRRHQIEEGQFAYFGG